MLQAVNNAPCRVCGKAFIRFSSFESAVICSSKRCLSGYVKSLDKARKDGLKQRKEAVKTRSEHLADAKKAIQQFRRLEELSKGRGCMSCNRSQKEVEGTDAWKPGGAWDGGHFLGKGARPELALEPLNIWLQCKSCNAGSGKYARKGYTVNANFRDNLIESEGAKLVDWLEGPHEPKHYSVDDLIAIKTTYRALTRQLLKEKEA